MLHVSFNIKQELISIDKVSSSHSRYGFVLHAEVFYTGKVVTYKTSLNTQLGYGYQKALQ